MEQRRGRKLCPDCHERALHPIERSPFSFGSLLAGTFSLLRHIGHAPLLLTVAMQLPFAAFFAASGKAAYVNTLYTYLVAVLAVAVTIDMSMQAINGEPRPKFARAWSAAVRSWKRIALTSLVTELIVGCGLLVIVPGMLMACMWCLAVPLAFLEGLDQSRARAESDSRMKGRKAVLFCAGAVLTIPLLVCIYLHRFIPSLAGLGGTNGRAAITVLANSAYVVLVAVAMYPLTVLSVVAYVKTRPDGALDGQSGERRSSR